MLGKVDSYGLFDLGLQLPLLSLDVAPWLETLDFGRGHDLDIRAVLGRCRGAARGKRPTDHGSHFHFGLLFEIGEKGENRNQFFAVLIFGFVTGKGFLDSVHPLQSFAGFNQFLGDLEEVLLFDRDFGELLVTLHAGEGINVLCDLLFELSELEGVVIESVVPEFLPSGLLSLLEFRDEGGAEVSNHVGIIGLNKDLQIPGINEGHANRRDVIDERFEGRVAVIEQSQTFRGSDLDFLGPEALHQCARSPRGADGRFREISVSHRTAKGLEKDERARLIERSGVKEVADAPEEAKSEEDRHQPQVFHVGEDLPEKEERVKFDGGAVGRFHFGRAGEIGIALAVG